MGKLTESDKKIYATLSDKEFIDKYGVSKSAGITNLPKEKLNASELWKSWEKILNIEVNEG